MSLDHLITSYDLDRSYDECTLIPSSQDDDDDKNDFIIISVSNTFEGVFKENGFGCQASKEDGPG